MSRWLRFLAPMAVLLGLVGPAGAASTVDSFTVVPVFPLPDPAITTENLWITQGGLDYKISPTKLGFIFQGTVAPLNPYTYQQWWDTSTSPVSLKVYDGSQWNIEGTLNTSTHVWSPPVYMNSPNGTTNVTIGLNSIPYNSTTLHSTAVGSTALTSLTSGVQNTAFGFGALGGITTSTNSVAVGYNACNSCIAGGVTAIGFNALNSGAGGGNGNTAVGYSAGTAMQSGGNNTIIGQSVGSATLGTGSGNILLGSSNAVDTPTSATSNYMNLGAVIKTTGINAPATAVTAISGTLEVGPNGTSNVAIGLNSMNTTTTTTNSTAVGSGALVSVTSGAGNTAYGQGSLSTVTSGANNVAVGANACNSCIGAGVTAIGSGALNSGAGGGNGNTAVGYNTGVVFQTAANNTILGQSVASTTLSTGSNNVLIGTSSAVDVASGATSNTINIQSTIKSTGTDAPATSITTIAGLLTLGNPVAVASLPTCNSGSKYQMQLVSDASGPTYDGTLTGGGARPVIGLCDGTNWKAH